MLGSEAPEALLFSGNAGSAAQYVSKCVVGEMRGDVKPADGGPAVQQKSRSGSVAEGGPVCRMSFRNGCSVILERSILVSNIAALGEMMYSSVRNRLPSVAGIVTILLA